MPIAIGDIHGCRRALESLLDFVCPDSEQTIVTLGDYIDRGPDSRGVVDCLLEMGRGQRLIALKGNHEQMMQDALMSPTEMQFWLSPVVGGWATLESYGGDPGSIPAEHLEFLFQARPYYESGRHLFVHGGTHPDRPLSEQVPLDLMCLRFPPEGPHQSGKTLVCGHTPRRDGKPTELGHSLCIDTFIYGGGWLTAYDTESGTFWQANEKGETRQPAANKD